MKKFLLMLMLVLVVFNTNYVFAVDAQFKSGGVIPGGAFTKYDGKTRYFRNAEIIENVDTGQVAYCIEPFDDLKVFTSYNGITEYDSRFGISKEKWDRIRLYAYYGYGYTGHTDKKWVSITQISIWRELYPNYEFDWIDSTSTKNTIYPYENEINELNSLVNSHYVLPSFESEYVLSIGDTLDLVDTNKVLNNFSLVSSDFEIELGDNSIKVLAGDNEKEGTITFERPKGIHSSDVTFFYNNASQNVIQSGNIEKYKYTINVKVVDGDVTVYKVNSESNDAYFGESLLDGAQFKLLDSDMNFISSLEVVDGVVKFDNLPFGKYYITEVSPGYGYYLNEEVYEVIIDKDNLNPSINIANDLIKVKVTINKYFGTKKQYEMGNMNKEENIDFEIYDDNKNLVFKGTTNNEGFIEVNLPFGKYILHQVNTTEGYQINNDYEFIIDKNENVEIVLYDFKINVPNAGLDYSFLGALCLNFLHL